MAFSPRASPAVGAFFGTPESARRVPGGVRSKWDQRIEAEALQQAAFQLPASILSIEPPLSHEFNRPQRDVRSSKEVMEALHVPPPTAPSGAHPHQPPRQGVVLASPRRQAALGQTARDASAWSTKSFELDTPYPIATTDSRFADAEADKAALATVAATAGFHTAAPVAGLSTGRQNTHGALPSMRRLM